MRASRGFTLIEVLVAMAILGLGLGAITLTFGQYARSAGILQNRVLGTWVAHNRLTEIEIAPVWPDEGDSNGEVEMAGLTWRWDVVVGETSDEHLRRINIQVRLLTGAKGSPKDLPVEAELNGFISDSGREDDG